MIWVIRSIASDPDPGNPVSQSAPPRNEKTPAESSGGRTLNLVRLQQISSGHGEGQT
jgi:hypothetical protein